MHGSGGMMPLAHYGGIDEVAIFVIPAVLAIVLLRWAERKAKARQKNEEEVGKVSADD